MIETIMQTTAETWVCHCVGAMPRNEALPHAADSNMIETIMQTTAETAVPRDAASQ